MEFTELERIGFAYELEYYDPDGRLVDMRTAHNLMPDEGVRYLLGVAFNNESQWPTFYCGLFSGDYSPYAQQTMANFPTNATEFSGYEGSARIPCQFSNPANNAISNASNKAVFEINQSGVIKGCFLATSAPKGATGGILVSAVRQPSPINVLPGGTLSVTAGFVVSSI
jgi:hypothetical protein